MTGSWSEEIRNRKWQERRNDFGEVGRNQLCRAVCIDFGFILNAVESNSLKAGN